SGRRHTVSKSEHLPGCACHSRDNENRLLFGLAPLWAHLPTIPADRRQTERFRVEANRSFYKSSACPDFLCRSWGRSIPAPYSRAFSLPSAHLYFTRILVVNEQNVSPVFASTNPQTAV